MVLLHLASVGGSAPLVKMIHCEVMRPWQVSVLGLYVRFNVLCLPDDCSPAPCRKQNIACVQPCYCVLLPYMMDLCEGLYIYQWCV